MSRTFRVYFTRRTSIDLYIDVEADSESEAEVKANEAVEEDDDILTELSEAYYFDCSPNGEIREIEAGSV